MSGSLVVEVYQCRTQLLHSHSLDFSWKGSCYDTIKQDLMWTAFITAANNTLVPASARNLESSLQELMQPHRIAGPVVPRKYSGYTILITSFMTPAITIPANL